MVQHMYSTLVEIKNDGAGVCTNGKEQLYFLPSSVWENANLHLKTTPQL